MASMMEVINNQFRSCHGVGKVPLTYIIRKIIVIETCGTYLWYATLDDKMIVRILHLLKEQKSLHIEEIASSRKSVQQPMR